MLKQILKAAAAGAAALLGAGSLLAQQANQSLLSFNVTNAITFATSYVGAPTNAVNPTNGVALGTGHWVDVSRGPTRAEIVVQFTNSATNVGNFTFNLVRSHKTSPYSWDFESTANYTFTVPGNGQNVVYWTTNLDDYAIGSISTIGPGLLTNSASAGSIGPVIETNSGVAVTNPIIGIQWRYPISRPFP